MNRRLFLKAAAAAAATPAETVARALAPAPIEVLHLSWTANDEWIWHVLAYVDAETRKVIMKGVVK